MAAADSWECRVQQEVGGVSLSQSLPPESACSSTQDLDRAPGIGTATGTRAIQLRQDRATATATTTTPAARARYVRCMYNVEVAKHGDVVAIRRTIHRFHDAIELTARQASCCWSAILLFLLQLLPLSASSSSFFNDPLSISRPSTSACCYRISEQIAPGWSALPAHLHSCSPHPAPSPLSVHACDDRSSNSCHTYSTSQLYTTHAAVGHALRPTATPPGQRQSWTYTDLSRHPPA